MFTHHNKQPEHSSDAWMQPEKFSHLIDSAHGASWILNLETQVFSLKILYVEGRDWKDINITLPASSVVQLIHHEDRQKIYNAAESAMKNQTHFSLQCRINQTQECWIEIAGHAHDDSPIISGKAFHVTTSVLAHRKREQELLDLIHKAEEANKNKSQFLANMSHEIRSPLSAMIGFSEVLSEDQLVTTNQKQYVEIIRRNGKALTKIIDDVLDLSKVESGNLKLEILEFSFPELINEVVTLFEGSLRSKKLSLVCRIAENFPAKIMSDSARLRQILVNLISNAIKFTPLGHITLDTDFRLLEKNQIQVDFRVKDTGIGLTEEQKKTLFVPYVQADSSIHRRFGGTGLGLALSQQLARALNGTLNIDPTSTEKGSCFKLSFTSYLPAESLPCAPVQPLQIAPLMQNPLTALNILIVEDSEDTQVFIGRIFSRHGINFQIAHDGEDAIRKHSSTSFDVILMDIKLPKISGYEVTRILRAKGYSKPIIALTAHAMESERHLSLEAGCDAHITKPIHIPTLFSTIQKHVKLKKG